MSLATLSSKRLGIAETLLVIAFLGVSYFALTHSSQPTSSELGFVSMSPAGAGGGVIIPASCESGYDHGGCQYFQFYADSTSVPYGGSTTLRWHAQGYYGCTAFGDWSGFKNIQGAQGTGALSSAKTYHLDCQYIYWIGENGYSSMDRKSVTVDVGGPSFTFTADSTSIPHGGSTTLRWTTSGYDSCRGTDGTPSWRGGWGQKALSGSEGTGSLTSNTTFTMECRRTVYSDSGNSTVTESLSVTITVGAQTCTPAYFCQGGNSYYRAANCTETIDASCTNGCNPSSGQCNPPPSCTPAYFCSGGNQYYRAANCTETLTQTCVTGCSNGSCNPSCTPQYFCSGGNVWFRNNLCQDTLSQSCTNGCGSGSCLPEDPITFVPFDPNPPTTPATVSGHLDARPALVRSGETTRLFWQLGNVTSVTVTGSNGDSWTGAFSGTSGKTSSPITGQVTYTLHAVARPGATPATFTETKVVNIIPVFQEQ